jgi:thiol:disulfide interchange protein DsbD
VYWRNAGDSGLPPKVEFTLPRGVTIGAAQWPAPTRHVQPGELVDYIFEDRLVLIFPIRVSEANAIDKKVSLAADVDWLVCSDRCVPGRAKLKSEFAVATSSKLSSDAELFNRARSRHPEIVGSGSAAKQYDAHWQGLELVINARNATRLTFFPYENDEGVYPKDMFARGETKSNVLKLPYPEEARKLKSVKGLISITRDHKEEYYEMSVLPPG